MADDDVIGFKTLQFHVGGVFDSRAVDDRIHLVRETAHGTPGPTLCGLERFGPNVPGWSVGGGVRGPEDRPRACGNCIREMRTRWPDLLPPTTGMWRDVFEMPPHIEHPDKRPPSIQCPRCGARSYHPKDIEQRYCGRCQWWTSDAVLGSAEVLAAAEAQGAIRPLSVSPST